MSNLKSAMGLFDSMKPATSTVLPSGDDIKHTTETLTKTRGGTTLYWKGEAFENTASYIHVPCFGKLMRLVKKVQFKNQTLC